MIDATTLRSVLDYNPITGVFVWKVRSSARTYPGDVAGCSDKEGYRQITYRRRTYFAHRLAWLYVYGEWPKAKTDHINGDKADNRIDNLRDVTQSQNMQNQYRAMKNSRTGFLGVRTGKRGNRFAAVININGKQQRLGWFSSPEEAHEVYMNAKKSSHISQIAEVRHGLGA